jgi:glucose 1-dehydrogenase
VDGGSLNDRLDNLARKTVNGRVGSRKRSPGPFTSWRTNQQSSFMTGQAMIVDGGATARLSTE